jgi:RNA polymerase sigma-70 factor (ECF subfamily)
MADAEALFAAHRAGLLRYLSRAVGHGETARDLTQDVFVRVVKAGELPGAEAERRAWLFCIARNIAIDHHRQRHVRGPEIVAVSEPSRRASQDTALEVTDALRQLDVLDRDVFLMREVAGLSYAEIGAACSITPDAVRSRIHRARLQLREYLSRRIATRRESPLRTKSKT